MEAAAAIVTCVILAVVVGFFPYMYHRKRNAREEFKPTPGVHFHPTRHHFHDTH